MKHIAAIAFSFICTLARAQVVPLQEPEFMACRDQLVSSELKRPCLRGAEAIADFKEEDPNVIERILLMRANSTEVEARALFGTDPRSVKPSLRARFDGSQYMSKSISWWALQDPSLSDEQRAERGGTIEVQFLNGLVAAVWWHRAWGTFLHMQLSDSPCVVGCRDTKKQGTQ